MSRTHTPRHADKHQNTEEPEVTEGKRNDRADRRPPLGPDARKTLSTFGVITAVHTLATVLFSAALAVIIARAAHAGFAAVAAEHARLKETSAPDVYRAYIEFSGSAQAQPNMLAKEAMDSKRDYMVQLGARLIEQNATAKTATQASGEQTSSTSVLGICVSNVSEAYTLALGWCAKYLGINGDEPAYIINQEFIAKVAESGMVTAIVNAWQSGALRDTDMIRALQKLDLINPSDSPDDVIDALRNQPPTLTGG